MQGDAGPAISITQCPGRAQEALNYADASPILQTPFGGDKITLTHCRYTVFIS
jgi:hypothetical protein